VRFYDRKEVKDVLAILKLLVNPRDSVSLERVCKNVLSGIGPASLNKIFAGVELTGKAKKSYEKLQLFLQKYDQTIPDQDIAPSEIVKKLVDYFQFETLLDDGTPSGQDHIENLSVLVSNAVPYTSLADFFGRRYANVFRR